MLRVQGLQVHHDPYSGSANRRTSLSAVPVGADNRVIIIMWIKCYVLGDNRNNSGTVFNMVALAPREMLSMRAKNQLYLY